MTTPNQEPQPSAQPDAPGTAMLPEEAQATVAEIKADNASLKIAEEIAEVQAEATEEQAKLLNEVAEEVLEELQEGQRGSREA